MRSRIVGLCVAFVLAAPSARAEDRFWVVARAGAYAPRVSRGDDLLAGRRRAAALDRQDFLGVTAGVELTIRAAGFLEMGAHVDGFVTDVDLPRTGPGGGGNVVAEAVVFGLSARLIPARPQARFRPYLAAGPDLLIWRYEESDRAAAGQADGESPGFHAAAGLRVSVAHDLELSAEYRRVFAKPDLNGAFAGQRLDLSGDVVTLGLAYRF